MPSICTATLARNDAAGSRRGRFADGERGGGRHSPCRDGGCACASDVCEQRKCGCVAGVHERLETRYFLRLSIQDEPGSLAKIATWLSSEQVSIATMMQKAELAGSRVPLIIITHEANEQAIRAALAKFDPEVCTVEI